MMVAWAGGAPMLPAQATSDVTAPTLVEFSFAPASVDVSAGPQPITFTARVTDDVSGTTFVFVTVRGPSGVNIRVSLPRISGNAFDGTWRGNVVIPQFAAAGTWVVTLVETYDVAGNSAFIATATLAQRFSTQFIVVSTPDIQAPIVLGTAVAPTSIDVSGADQTVTVILQVADDISGVSLTSCAPGPILNGNDFAVQMRSPSGAQNRFIRSFATFTRTAGTILAGTWQATFSMPKSSEPGVWRFQTLFLRDCAGNTRTITDAQLTAAGQQVALSVTSNPSDTEAPVLTSLAYLPIALNTSTGNQIVTVQLGVRDNLAGTEFSPTTPNLSFFESGIGFRSPSGAQARNAAFFTPFNLISGTVLDGVWQSTIQFPQFSEEGTWHVDVLTIKDRTRNVRTFNRTMLEAAGFPTALEVIKPSLISDGTVVPNTGIVGISDDKFGDLAKVFVPSSALTAPTTVAIDVLSQPIDVPNPTGFSGAGSYFVNIELTPKPNYPLPFPGLTLILPLRNPLPDGLQLTLYKIDEKSGGLIPAVGVFGGPVLGTVDAGGLSATFAGVASLSTVVGLLPEVLKVAIDIKPGDAANGYNLKSRGFLPVAILGSSTFDASTVRPETVLLAGAAPRLKGNGQPLVSLEDVNGDGRLDMVLQFDTEALEITSSDTEAELTGRTTNGLRIAGTDAIRIVP